VIEGLGYITVIFQLNAISGKQGSDLHFCFRFTSSVCVKRLLVLFYTVCKFFSDICLAFLSALVAFLFAFLTAGWSVYFLKKNCFFFF